MAVTQKQIRERVLKRADFFETHLAQDEDLEGECQWVRTPTSGKCGNKGVVYIWETEHPVFPQLEQGLQEHIMCKECIKHFVNGIRKRWRKK